MFKSQYKAEAVKWESLRDLCSSTRAPRVTKTSVVSVARDAVKKHLSGIPTLHKSVPFRDWEYAQRLSTKGAGGYSLDSTGVVLKDLDLGHKSVDVIESMLIKFDKLYQNKEDQRINYSAPWQHCRLLTAEDDLQLKGATGFTLQEGTYMFVICRDGAIRYFPNDDELCEDGGKPYIQHLPHAALADHKSVLAAGNLGVDGDGTLIWATSNSGHYRVDDQMCCHNLEQLLRLYGYYYAGILKKRSTELMESKKGSFPKPFKFYSYSEYQEVQANARYGMEVASRNRPSRNDVVDLMKEGVRAVELVRAKNKGKEDECIEYGNTFDSITNDDL